MTINWASINAGGNARTVQGSGLGQPGPNDFVTTSMPDFERPGYQAPPPVTDNVIQKQAPARPSQPFPKLSSAVHRQDIRNGVTEAHKLIKVLRAAGRPKTAKAADELTNHATATINMLVWVMGIWRDALRDYDRAFAIFIQYAKIQKAASIRIAEAKKRGDTVEVDRLNTAVFNMLKDSYAYIQPWKLVLADLSSVSSMLAALLTAQTLVFERWESYVDELHLKVEIKRLEVVAAKLTTMIHEQSLTIRTQAAELANIKQGLAGITFDFLTDTKKAAAEIVKKVGEVVDDAAIVIEEMKDNLEDFLEKLKYPALGLGLGLFGLALVYLFRR